MGQNSSAPLDVQAFCCQPASTKHMRTESPAAPRKQQEEDSVFSCLPSPSRLQVGPESLPRAQQDSSTPRAQPHLSASSGAELDPLKTLNWRTQTHTDAQSEHPTISPRETSALCCEPVPASAHHTRGQQNGDDEAGHLEASVFCWEPAAIRTASFQPKEPPPRVPPRRRQPYVGKATVETFTQEKVYIMANGLTSVHKLSSFKGTNNQAIDRVQALESEQANKKKKK
jgi:hypothetical protein